MPALNPEEREPMSPGVSVRRDIRAAILIEAAIIGDEAACLKYGVARRTLQKWRRSIAGGDEALAAELARKQDVFEERWLQDLDITIGKAIRTVGTVVDQIALDPKVARNPLLLREVVNAIRVMTDAKMASKVIDARLKQLKGDQEPPELGDGPREGEMQLGPHVFISSPSNGDGGHPGGEPFPATGKALGTVLDVDDLGDESTGPGDGGVLE